MEKQDNIISPKVHNFSITESKDIEMVEMLDKELKNLQLKND
jgi:hypothetical protein